MDGVVIVVIILALILAAAKFGGGVFRPRDLRTAERTPYTARPVLGYEEAIIFYKIDNWVKRRRMGERVFPQVPMGAYLATPDDEAHRVIRFKRPDYVIVNKKGMPICVVEYQGGGHYQGDAAHRDKIKQAALNNADIPLVEIFAHEKDDAHAIYHKLDGALADLA